ncbi:MAG: hypothetical protein JNM66_08315 [Bryobacterales bacterium]|nr:hypothetical protein [Bryobacterales bacterium]
MSSPNSRLFPLAGVAAGILVHNVALTAYHQLEHALASTNLQQFNAPPAIIFTLGALIALAAYFLARSLRSQLEHRSGQPAKSFLDATIGPASLTRSHTLLLLAYGLVAIVFLSALHAVAHVFWHLSSHYLPPLWLALSSAAAVLLLAEYVRRHEHHAARLLQGEPGEIDGLILFLSNAPPEDAARFQSLVAGRPMPWSREFTTQTLGSHKWAMPARSVSRIWRNRQLRHVVVIGSTTTHPLIPLLTAALAPAMQSSPVQFHPWPAHAGVDFSDANSVTPAVQSAFAFLESQQCTRIAVDVTSGTVICSATGLLESMSPGRGAIYVTNDHTVRAYRFQAGEKHWTPLPHEGP